MDIQTAVTTAAEVITEPECRSGLRKDSTIFAEAGAWPESDFWKPDPEQDWECQFLQESDNLFHQI